MLFAYVRNKTLFEVTKGKFPGGKLFNLEGDHPIFVMELTVEGPQACPCSSKDWEIVDARRYIYSGAVTDTGWRVREDTFLVDEHSFTVPRSIDERSFFEDYFTNIRCPDMNPLLCLGVVQKKDIKERI